MVDGMAPMSDSDRFRLADVMADTADRLDEEQSLDDALDAAVHTVLGAVPGVDHASVTRRLSNGRLETVAATDQLVRDLDELQYETGEGPCVHALTSGESQVIDQRDNPDQWPRFTLRANELGVRARMAYLLTRDAHMEAVLNLYSTEVDEFDIDTQHIGRLFATHAAIAMGKARVEEGLNLALSTRKEIGQAIGILMERYSMDEDRAFQFLVRVSRSSNMKLRDISREMVKATDRRAPDGPDPSLPDG